MALVESGPAVEIEEAVSRLVVVPDYDPGGGDGPGPCVHSFRCSALMLGAHWRLEQVREAMERFGVHEAIPPLTGHGLLVVDETGPVVFESRDGT